MIRLYTSQDLNAVVAIVRKGDHMLAQDVFERLEKWTTLMWEDGDGVKGVACYQKEDEGEFNVRVYADPSFRQSGIRSALCSAAFEGIATLGKRGRITTKYRIDCGGALGFFRKRGFNYWYGMDSLAYDGPRMPDPNLLHIPA